MHDDWQPPHASWDRIATYGPEWEAEWQRAWRAMRPYGRFPSLHVIDNLFRYPSRTWMRSSWGEIAALSRGHARRQVGAVPDHATLGGAPRRVAVVQDPDTGKIVTVHNA